MASNMIPMILPSTHAMTLEETTTETSSLILKPCRIPSGFIALNTSNNTSNNNNNNNSNNSILISEMTTLTSASSSPSGSSSLSSSFVDGDDDDDDDDDDESLLSSMVVGRRRAAAAAAATAAATATVSVPNPRQMRRATRGAADEELWFFDCAGADCDAESVAEWHDLCMTVFKDGELDSLECFLAALSADNAAVRSHLYLAMKGDQVVGGAYVEYYAKCKSALLAYIVVDANIRGLGIGKKLFDASVAGLENSHREIVALFAETHGATSEDGVFPSAARQKYFNDLGFQQVNVPYFCPVLFGHEEHLYDYVLIVRPLGRYAAQGKPISVNTSLVRTFIVSYYDFVSSWLYEDVEEDDEHLVWLLERGYGDEDYDGVSKPFLFSSSDDSSLSSDLLEKEADDDDDMLLAASGASTTSTSTSFTRLNKTPWDMMYYQESLDRFVRSSNVC